jgi:hypothetical protein
LASNLVRQRQKIVKYFSEKDYGFDEAMRLAIQHRGEMERRLYTFNF